jgi:lactoylglutathione lyase
VKQIITGLFETHLKVRNLERAIRFYEDVIGLELGTFDPNRKLAIYWIIKGQSMLGLWEVPEEQWFKQHFAFSSTLENMHTVRETLEHHGLEWRNFLEDDSGSLHVFGWMPAVSVYFQDPDGHSLEILAMLPDDPKPELGLVPWAQWEALQARQVLGSQQEALHHRSLP